MKLSQICTLKQWKTISKNQLVNDGYPVYGANGIIGYSNEFNHETPTLMIGCRGTCGEIHLSEGKAYINGNAMCLDNLSSEFDINYVKYFLEHYDFSKIITGTAQPQITQQGLDKVQISKIPLEEQKLIASKITNIKELTSIETNAIRNLDSLIKSRFNEQFISNPSFLTKKWHEVLNIINGRDYKGHEGTQYPIYGSGGFMGIYANNFLASGILTIIGRKGTIDRPLLVNGEIWNIDTAFAIKTNDEILNPVFFHYRSKFYDYQNLNKQTTKPSLRKSDLLKLDIEIPPMAIQLEFIKLVEIIDKLKFNCQQRIKLYQELLDKKMDEYFG